METPNCLLSKVAGWVTSGSCPSGTFFLGACEAGASLRSGGAKPRFVGVMIFERSPPRGLQIVARFKLNIERMQHCVEINAHEWLAGDGLDR